MSESSIVVEERLRLKRERWNRWAEKNREYLCAKDKLRRGTDEYRARSRELYNKNPHSHRERCRKWRKTNPDKVAANIAKYKARKLKATPPWLTEEHFSEIKVIYREAAINGLTVDHIVPMKNPNVCGLHVPWNLQLLSMDENRRKTNRISQ